MVSVENTLWKQLMDNGVFDDYYPQRLNACFHYLCCSSDITSNEEKSNKTSFSLKDLIQKGSFVFSYLSVDVGDKDSSFAIMDIFRSFDRSGRGSVFLEEFVLGILERLNVVRKDYSLLESIAEDLLSVESRCTELATLLEKGNTTSSKFFKFNLNLKSISNIIKIYIRNSKSQEHLSALDLPSLIKLVCFLSIRCSFDYRFVTFD
jgi:hypothetical protein